MEVVSIVMLGQIRTPHHTICLIVYKYDCQYGLLCLHRYFIRCTGVTGDCYLMHKRREVAGLIHTLGKKCLKGSISLDSSPSKIVATCVCVSLHPVLQYLTCTMLSLASFDRSLLIPSSFTEVVTPTVISTPAVRWAAGSEG